MEVLSKDNIVIKELTFNELLSMKDDREGIVILGAGEPHVDWIHGLNEIWHKAGIVPTNTRGEWEDFYLLTTTGGRTDLVMMWGDEVDVGKLTGWRWSHNPEDFSWVSDYLVNYADHH